MSPLKLTLKWFGRFNSFWRSSDKSPSKSSSGAGGFPDHGSEHGASERVVQDDMEATRPRTASYVRSSEGYTHMCTLPRLLGNKKEKGDSKKSREKSNNQNKSQKSSGDQSCPPSTPTGVPSRVDEDEISTPDRMELNLEPPLTSKIQFEPAGESKDHSNSPAPLLSEDLPPPSGLNDTVQSEEEVAESNDETSTALLDQEIQEDGCSEATPPSTPKEEGGLSEATPPYIPKKEGGLSEATPPYIPKEEGGLSEATPPYTPKEESGCSQTTPPSIPKKGGCSEATPPYTPKKVSGCSEATPPSTSKEEDSKEEKKEQQNSTNLSSHIEPEEHQAENEQFSKEKYLLESPPEKLRKELEEELKLSPADIRSHGWYHGHIPQEVSESLVVRNGDFLVHDSLTNVGDFILTCRWDNEVLHFKINKVLVKSNETKVQYMLESDCFDSVQELVRFYVGQRKPLSQSCAAHIYCPVSRTLPLRYLEATFALASSKHGSAYSPSTQRGAHIKRRSVTMTDGLTTEKMIPHSPSTVHHHKDAMRNCAMSMDQIQEFRCPLSPVGEIPLSPAHSAIARQRAFSSGRALAVVPPSPVMRRSSDPQLSPTASSSPPELPTHTSQSANSSPAHHSSHQSHSSETAGSYCDLRPCASGPPKPPTKSYVERLRVEERRKQEVKEEEGTFSSPQVETASSFRPARYESHLLPAENKPLEMSVLKKVKELLAEVDARTAAKHITMYDCKVARILGVTSEVQRMMGVSSGLELLTLPHGHQLRLDLLERFFTMSIMMAVDLLGCTGSTEERAALLHKTIQLAAELKNNLGNMFGFAAVMRALELPQISRLEQTWVTLRQRHTEGAILYEKKLKPFMKNMNNGKAHFPTQPSHTSSLCCRCWSGAWLSGRCWSRGRAAEVGVDVVMYHLEAARTIAHHGEIYRTNAESKLQGLQERPELDEIFQTEFQMRLLWGCRGSEGSQSERYEKFDKVLTALSLKLEPPARHSEL
ncbi:SH2 domain-containing protein 3C [Oryzias melastigma]|uniref:SH2 domain-containing protein 3C n=1 Tax=Oryzias melastigma TaxID=30732 RepID=A0A834CE44_ORYME|nr:SH2 domain-containing protein 3C [Oryzias melastigma]